MLVDVIDDNHSQIERQQEGFSREKARSSGKARTRPVAGRRLGLCLSRRLRLSSRFGITSRQLRLLTTLAQGGECQWQRFLS